MNLVQGILFSLKIWKLLLCNCPCIQNFVVHRKRDEEKLLHVKKRVIDGSSNNFSGLLLFFECQKIFPLLSNCTSLDEEAKLVWENSHELSSDALQVSFEQSYKAFTKKQAKFQKTRLNEITFAVAGKRLKHFQQKEILCVHHPKI